jgi:hypothetical protein
MKIEDCSEEWIRRFWQKVDKSAGPDGCWIWLAGKDKDGYGSVTRPGGKGHIGAHRASLILDGKEFTPEKNTSRHLCHTPACVNPSHLCIGSQQDNVADRVAAGRTATGDRHGSRTRPESRATGDRNGARKYPERLTRGDDFWSRKHPERVPRGEDHFSAKYPEKRLKGSKNPAAKLTEEKVEEIRRRYAEGGISQTQLAKEYGVAQGVVSAIILRKTWKHVP